MTFRPAALLSSALLVVTPATAGPAVEPPAVIDAERDDSEDAPAGDIVVLGTRRAPADAALSSGAATERLSPASRAIERDLLTAAGTYRLSDALELVSGVSQQNNCGGVMDNFAIRGFLGTPDGGAEYYVDGFLANRGMAPPRDPATTERVELLKGPAGALFGDIDPAGRVILVSKTPAFSPAASATLGVGSFRARLCRAAGLCEGQGGGGICVVAAVERARRGGQSVRRTLRPQLVQPRVDLPRRAAHRPCGATHHGVRSRYVYASSRSSSHATIRSAAASALSAAVSTRSSGASGGS